MADWTLDAVDGDRQLYADKTGTLGVVVDGDKIFDSFNLQSIYARGGWETPSPDAQDRSDEVAKHVATKGG